MVSSKRFAPWLAPGNGAIRTTSIAHGELRLNASIAKHLATALAGAALLAACSATPSAPAPSKTLASASAPATAAAKPARTLRTGRNQAPVPVPPSGFVGQDFPGLRESRTLANCDPGDPDNANFATTVIDVGPGAAITSLANVPWESLSPHTMVRVLPKTTPYNERIFIVTSDIKVCGVRDANGV